MYKSNKIENLFYYIVACSYLFIPIGFLIVLKRKKLPIAYVILSYGITAFILLIFYHELSREGKKVFQPAYTFYEYLTFTVIFWYNIKNERFKKIMILLSALFFIFQIFYYFQSKLLRLDSIPIAIETIFVFVYIVYFFYEFSKKIRTYYIYNHYCFWIAVGILIYLGGSFFFYLSINELNSQEVETFGNLTYLAEIIKNILFGVALIILSKNHLSLSDEKKNINVPFLDMI